MAIEQAKTKDIPQKPSKQESQPAAALQKEAISDLSSNSKKGSDKAIQTKVKNETKDDGKSENPKAENKRAVEQKTETKKNESGKVAVAEAQTDKVNAVDKKEKSTENEKNNLTPELKSAVEKANKITVKLPPAGADNSDVLIKADGKIQHSLNMEPKREESKNLTITFEAKDGSNLTAEQSKSLKTLTEFAEANKKDLKIDTPEQTSTQIAEQAKAKSPERVIDQEKLQTAKTAGKTDDSSAIEKERVKQTSTSSPESSSVAANNRSYAPQSPKESYEQPARSYSNQSDRSATTSDTSFAPPRPADQPQMTLSEILMDWFNSDPEKFKKLMPELYKLIAGADGKLDPNKLKMLQDSNDPSWAKIKETLSVLAPEFPQSKAFSSGSLSMSADAINPTGAVLAEKAAQVSDELSGSGYCAKGVSAAIERATGKTIYGNANDMRETLPGNGFKEASSNELKVGQIVHVYWTPEVYAQEKAKRGNCPNYGDIAVIGKGKDGQLYAFNDNAIPLNAYLNKSRYDWNTLKVFNPPANA